MTSARRILCACIMVAVGSLVPRTALAWGDEGHRIVALIAEHYLDPGARARVSAMLAADTDSLTAHDITNEATWADKYRDSDRNSAKEHYLATRQWHFVDIELSKPDLDQACFGRPRLPAGTVAANGPAQACVVDKIEQFAAELADPATNPEERLLALKFLLNLVGDLHQPLHAADDHDSGGNRKRVSTSDYRPGNLHSFWDSKFVERLGRDPKQIAIELIGRITDAQRQEWSQGTPGNWAQESFALARDHAYGMLSEPSPSGVYMLSPAYIEAATRDAAVQLSKAGVRLAFVLNRAL